MIDHIIPSELLPQDGRFGSGPSKVRPEALARLAEIGDGLLGTSHRQDRVRGQVARLQEGVRQLFALPDDYQVVLAVGGATAFWESLAFGLVEQRSRHYSFGEFSSKFAAATTAAPWLDDPDVIASDPGDAPEPSAAAGCDVQALTHNETSTGVTQGLARVDDALVVVDATSGAGGIAFDIDAVDVYYFSLQKGFAAEGGLTVALMSPAAVERVGQVSASGRYIPTFLDLGQAIENSSKAQTYNTPSVSTVVLAAEQVDWMLTTHGGLEHVARHQQTKAAAIYEWAETRSWASPFVQDLAKRSPMVATIDLDEAISADEVNVILRSNGIVDTDGYRKLGRNQLRVAMFPAVDLADLEAYTGCVDWIVEQIA
ncbi:MAG: phosphoserine transaminase [Nitriliruptoraceae bacterium]